MTSFDPKILGGSVKSNIVNPDLVEERAKIGFDKNELARFMYSEESLQEFREIYEFIKKNPNIQTDIKFFEYDRT